MTDADNPGYPSRENAMTYLDYSIFPTVSAGLPHAEASELATRQMQGGRRHSRIARILPFYVSEYENPIIEPVNTLHIEERALTQTHRMSPNRKLEFTRGRVCARNAMAALGTVDAPVLIAASGGPEWPKGLIGSITHCTDYCAAAVARTANVQAIGIDAELWPQFPIEITDHIATSNETQCFDESTPLELTSCILFSAKESIYKALNPMIMEFFSFLDVSINVSESEEKFNISSSSVIALEPYIGKDLGRYTMSGGLVLTSYLCGWD